MTSQVNLKSVYGAFSACHELADLTDTASFVPVRAQNLFYVLCSMFYVKDEALHCGHPLHPRAVFVPQPGKDGLRSRRQIPKRLKNQLRTQWLSEHAE